MVRRQVRNKRDRSKRREFDVIVVAGDKVIVNYLTRHKIYAMAMGDETMTLINFDQVSAG